MKLMDSIVSGEFPFINERKLNDDPIPRGGRTHGPQPGRMKRRLDERIGHAFTKRGVNCRVRSVKLDRLHCQVPDFLGAGDCRRRR